MSINWTAVAAATGLLLAIGAAVSFGSRIGKLEGQLEWLHPERVEDIKREIEESRSRMIEAAARQIDAELSEIEENTALRIAEVTNAKRPEQLHWCSPNRELGEWYDSGEYGTEIGLTISPVLTDPENSIYTCSFRVEVRNALHAPVLTTIAGYRDARYQSQSFQCTTEGTTIPPNTQYRLR